jgi:hypothetical protein
MNFILAYGLGKLLFFARKVCWKLKKFATSVIYKLVCDRRSIIEIKKGEKTHFYERICSYSWGMAG